MNFRIKLVSALALSALFATSAFAMDNKSTGSAGSKGSEGSWSVIGDPNNPEADWIQVSNPLGGVVIIDQNFLNTQKKEISPQHAQAVMDFNNARKAFQANPADKAALNKYRMSISMLRNFLYPKIKSDQDAKKRDTILIGLEAAAVKAHEQALKAVADKKPAAKK